MFGLLSGLGKPLTKYGKFIYKHGYNIQEVSKASKVNRTTVGKACTDKDYLPSSQTMRKLLKVARKMDPDVDVSDFWRI